MGNNASLTSLGAKGVLNNAAKDLGLGDNEAAAAERTQQQEATKAANKKEQELRAQERTLEYKRKTLERETRKAKLKEKWEASRQQK
jgi:hypothetical protein